MCFISHVKCVSRHRSGSFGIIFLLCLVGFSIAFLPPCHNAYLATTCHRSTNAFAVAQVAPQSRLPLDVAAEGRKALSRVEPAEDFQDLAVPAATSTNAGMSVFSNSWDRKWPIGRFERPVLHRIQANPAPKPHRISDLIPRNWEGSIDKRKFRHVMSDVDLGMQALSDKGETLLVHFEGIDKLGRQTPLSIDCSPGAVQNNGGRRCTKHCTETTANEPLRIVQQTQGTGFEVARNHEDGTIRGTTSDKNSGYAAPSCTHQ